MRSRFRTTISTGFLLLLAAVACDDSDSTSPPPRTPVAAVRVTPAQHSLTVGQTLELEATPVDEDGKALDDRLVTWSSSNAAVATVSGSGVVEAKSEGPVTITASSEGAQGRATVTVARIPVASVTTSVTELDLEIGDGFALSATPKDADGNELAGRVVIWLSSDPLTATVTPNGLNTATVTAHRTGTVTLTARSEGKNADVAVTISPVGVARVVASAPSTALDVGQTMLLSAVAYDKNDNPLTDRAAEWTSSNGAVATVNAQGLVHAAGAGEATITVTIGGKSATVALRVTTAPTYDLLYSRMAPSGIELFVLSLVGNGAAPQKLNAGNVSMDPTPRPDGERIAFHVAMVELGTQRTILDIFAVDRNGMNMKRLTTSEENSGADQPAWSPDGTRIAFRRSRPGPSGNDIWVMNADGTNQVNLTQGISGVEYLTPAWSPDSRQIAFSRGTEGSFGIYVMNVDGTGLRKVVETEGFDVSPTWSPDGRQIAFVRQPAASPDYDIVIVNVDGTGLRRIAIPGLQHNPAWSPDGDFIAFGSRVPGNPRTELYTVRTDGTELRLRTTNPEWGGGSYPAWIRRR